MIGATMRELLLLSGSIAIGFLLAVAFYESMSTRDVLVPQAVRYARDRSDRRWVRAAAYVAVVGIVVPLLVLFWAVVLEAALFFVESIERVESIALIAVSIVAATRILAYIREKTSHELAKAVPLAFAFLLLSGGAINLEDKLARAAARPDATSLTIEMVTYLVGLEVALRIATDGAHAALAGYRRRHGLGDDVGFWRILWQGLRSRPRSPASDA
jgi:hypothetical protein